MGKGEDGWCIALDQSRMCCGIYDRRPAVCREFEMAGADCRAERAAWRQANDRCIPLRVR
jgi:Fe-S-cluster containining protein